MPYPDHKAELRHSLVRDLIQHRPGWQADYTIEQARLLADFILGTNDAEIIGAAREFAAKVKP